MDPLEMGESLMELYIAILEETLVGYMVPAYTKVVRRKLRQSPKFYFFDVSIPNYLLGRKSLQPGSDDFGHAFEHLVIQELIEYLGYNNQKSSNSIYGGDADYETTTGKFVSWRNL